MNRQEHWDKVYDSRAVTSLSWYRPHLETSLELIKRFAELKHSAILDIGGGASTLVDDLVGSGYDDLTVLDIAGTALAVSQARMGDGAARIHWITADFLKAEFESGRYDLCHDRAVFHFLTSAEEKTDYLTQAKRILRPGGVLVLATFALDGPERCSGLVVSQYDEAALRTLLGGRFDLVESRRESHRTPVGGVQEMMYFVLRSTPSPV